MTLSLRRAQPSDAAVVTALLAKSYPRLLATDYPPETLDAALPKITQARPSLLAGGTYFLALEGGTLVAAGGWSTTDPWGGLCPPGTAHVRHVVTCPDHVRQGFGRRLMAALCADAQAQQITRFECYSTLTARGFYAACGFAEIVPVVMALGPGIAFPAVHMRRICDPPGQGLQ
jgi:GNAT superfamily N-acetyltransferase